MFPLSMPKSFLSAMPLSRSFRMLVERQLALGELDSAIFAISAEMQIV